MLSRAADLRRRVYQVAALLLLSGWGTVAPVAAQGTASAVVVGVVSDAQGGVLPGVAMTLRNVDTGGLRTSVTEGDGRYRLPGLLPGRYDLTAELPGFTNAEVKDLALTIGLELRRDITMSPAGVQESVTVTGVAPVVDASMTEVAMLVTQEQIESLPVANRQAAALLLLLPGTNYDFAGSSRAQPNIGGGGGSNAMNAYYVDGGFNMLPNSGQQMIEIPQSAVREFKVNVSGASAQYGAVGGVVLTATKSGTNLFSGEAFEYFGHKSLNARDQLNEELGTPKPDYTRHQNGGAFGGPIVRDRLHFFVAFERSKSVGTAAVNTGQPRFYSALEGNFASEYERRWFVGRGDVQITSQQNAFIRYAYDQELTVCQSCGGINAAFTGTDTRSGRRSMLVGHTWVANPRMVNEIRSQIPPSHSSNREMPPGLPKWPQDKRGEFPPDRFADYTPLYIFPSLQWGGNSWQLNWTGRWDVSDTVTISLGPHTLTLGGAYLHFFSDEEQPHNIGTWMFDTDQFFDGSAAAIANLRAPVQFQASFPPVMRYLKSDWIQGYISDEWRPRSNLTLELGLRYENQYKSFNNHLDLTPIPRLRELIDPTVRGDHNNFGPRAGFAWDVRSDGRTVVRGLSGITYQPLIAGALRNEMVALRQTAIVIPRPSYPDPYGGRSPESFASTTPPNVNVTDDKIENARATTFSLGLSQELRPNLALHLDGVYTNVDKMSQTANVNTPGPVTGLRPLPTWGRIIQYRGAGKHEYRALFVRLDKRFAKRHQYLLSYTLSKQDNEGASGQITDFYNPGADWGPGSVDRRHAFVASASVRLPFDVMVGGVWTLRSTRPFSALAGRDLNADGSSTDYVPGTTRNMGNRDTEGMLTAVNAWRAQNGRASILADQIDTNGHNKVDVRASKVILLGTKRRIEVIAQVFNLFGRDMLGSTGNAGWVENALSDSFGRILTVAPRQQAELAVRLAW